ncbi:MAG: hypothetical protein AAGI70_02185 [Pseudomonadota bacterium]
MTRLPIAACLMLCLVAACTSPTPYQPRLNANGYFDQKVEDNRFIVSFRGNSRTARETVETYLLFRAAEVTLASGNDWFRINERGGEDLARRGWVQAGKKHHRRFRRHRRFRSGVRVGVFFSPFFLGFPYHHRRVAPERIEAVANIQVFPGPKPEGDPQAYDANQVIANLGPQIRRP